MQYDIENSIHKKTKRPITFHCSIN